MKLLGVNYHNITVPEAMVRIQSLIAAHGKATVLFLNADCLYKSQKDPAYRAVLNQADLLLSDGIGIRLATKIFGATMKDNCNGTDLSPKILQLAQQHGYKVFFLGGKPGVALKAKANALQQMPRLPVVGTSDGFFKDDQAMIQQINSSGAEVLFVALGAPKQEKWIAQHRASLMPSVCLGVGAFLDYLSGSIPRAPRAFRRLHLEWFWRVFVDPKRMIKRYFVDGFCFVVFVFYQRLLGRRDPQGGPGA